MVVDLNNLSWISCDNSVAHHLEMYSNTIPHNADRYSIKRDFRGVIQVPIKEPPISDAFHQVKYPYLYISNRPLWSQIIIIIWLWSSIPEPILRLH